MAQALGFYRQTFMVVVKFLYRFDGFWIGITQAVYFFSDMVVIGDFVFPIFINGCGHPFIVNCIDARFFVQTDQEAHITQVKFGKRTAFAFEMGGKRQAFGRIQVDIVAEHGQHFHVFFRSEKIFII